MGYVRWYTKPECAWLEACFAKFQLAQTEAKTAEFMTSTVQEYFNEFFPGVVIPGNILEEVSKQQKGSNTAAIATVTAVGGNGTQVDLLARARVSYT